MADTEGIKGETYPPPKEKFAEMPEPGQTLSGLKGEFEKIKRNSCMLQGPSCSGFAGGCKKKCCEK